MDKVNQYQKLISECYHFMSLLRKAVENLKQERLRNEMKSSRYLQAVKKNIRIVEECSNGSFEFLKYKQFAKSCDSSFKELLTQNLSTAHPMFNLPFSGYKKVEECNNMQVIVTAKSKLPPFSQMAITADPEGKNVIELISTQDLIENQTINAFIEINWEIQIQKNYNLIHEKKDIQSDSAIVLSLTKFNSYFY